MMTKNTPKILSASTVLAHIPELRPQKCEFSAQRAASCGHMKNTLRAFPNFSFKFPGRWIRIFYLEMKIYAVGCRLMLPCASFASYFFFHFQ
jgi:hypothetical protein